MALLFVGGGMTLVWIALIALVVLLEKTMPLGGRMSKLSGILLVGWGAASLIRMS